MNGAKKERVCDYWLPLPYDYYELIECDGTDCDLCIAFNLWQQRGSE